MTDTSTPCAATRYTATRYTATPYTATDAGIPVAGDEHSPTVGPNGPILLQARESAQANA